jgi:hypothetical protein
VLVLSSGERPIRFFGTVQISSAGFLPLSIWTRNFRLGHGLMRAFPIDNAVAIAKQFAEGAAHALLPGARWRCHDRNTVLEEKKEELERIRAQLTEEIAGVRGRRAELEKQLELEVER